MTSQTQLPTPPDDRARARQAIQQASERGDAGRLVEALRQLIRLEARPADFAYAAGRLQALGAERAREAGLRPVRTFCARSVTIEPLLPHLIVHGACAGLWLSFEIGGYGSFADELMSPAASLARFKPDLVMLLSDEEDLAGDLREACAGASAEEIDAAVARTSERLCGMIAALRKHSPARLLVQGLLQPAWPVLGEVGDANLPASEAGAIRRINEALARTCREVGDAVLFDQDRVAARCGRAAWRDERMFRSTRLAVAAPCFDAYARGLIRSLRPLFFPARKVLVSDLDNTLWGGIVGEDGPDAIVTGSDFPGNCYKEYQRLLRQLSRRGVLLALASKNNPPDVKEAFERRSRDLLLKLEDFVAVEVGWSSKVESLQRIAKTLSLGLDSFVFVDDSPTECAEVRQSLPEVLVVQVPGEPWRISAHLNEHLHVFDQLTITDDDRQRVKEYQSQRQRSELEAGAGSREEFLGSLGIVCTVVSALEAPLSRTAQLIGKTNQFNLTTRRHSAGDVERIAAAPGSQAWAVRVRDRFGDAGVVGVVLCRAQGPLCVIDTFLLSCRVIGRNIESALLWWVGKNAIAAGATHLVGEYIPTKKNPPCADFYTSHGFVPMAPSPSSIEGATGTLFQLDLSAGPPPLPAWISFEATP